VLAASGPDRENALRLAHRLRLAVRYQGPKGPGDDWATEPALPAVPSAPGPGVRACGPDCWAVTRADGSAYLFQWALHRDTRAAHDRVLVALLVLLVALVAAAHEVLRRTLAPLRTLRDGVAALAGGDLEVALPRRRDDELGALTDAFNGMVARVREMVRSRDRLLLDVSHELRSPLTRMKVALALAPEGEDRARLERDVAQMEALVTDLLELERLRAGRGLERAPHDVALLVRSAALAFEGRPPGLELGPLPAALPLPVDAERLRTVLDNLLENAFKYSLEDSGPVRLTLAEGAGEVTLAIEDDGPGIPEEALSRVFEPFYRVDPSRSRRTGGFGLGLPLCQRIVEAHGGAIRAERRPGRGSRFVVTLQR
jgi:signal transduction histidine kinase